MIEESEKFVVQDFDLEAHDEKNSSVVEVRLKSNISSPYSPTCRTLRWLTLTLHDAQVHIVGIDFKMIILKDGDER